MGWQLGWQQVSDFYEMKFIQISDLHYCPEKDGRASRELRSELPKYIRETNLKADELFVTGDYFKL